MFNFARDDGLLRPPMNKNQLRHGYRIDDWKHNPYVGSFHTINYSSAVQNQSDENRLAEAKTNPLIGVFRHSPSSVTSKALGLKGIIYENETSATPILSQLQVARDPKVEVPKRNFVTALRRIPHSVYSTASSVCSTHSPPPVVHENTNNNVPTATHSCAVDDDVPVCAICLECYNDGDNILTLACSHCYHSECVSKWFFQDCLNSTDLGGSFRCPQCRQDHILLSERGSQCSDPVPDFGISQLSFIQVGQSLLRDGGYDFLSDIGSECSFPSRKEGSVIISPPPTPIREAIQRSKAIPRKPMNSLGCSLYSDCGFPLKEAD